MNLKRCASACCAAVIALTALAAVPTEAATKKRVVTHTRERVVITRPRTRVIVRNRSFLDPGTESFPGESRYTGYALPPGYSPTGVVANTPFYHRGPLPGPFDLPSRDNPWPWNW